MMQVFDLLWRLISHDIWFVWERVEYLQVEDLDVLTQVAFKVCCPLTKYRCKLSINCLTQ